MAIAGVLVVLAVVIGREKKLASDLVLHLKKNAIKNNIYRVKS